MTVRTLLVAGPNGKAIPLPSGDTIQDVGGGAPALVGGATFRKDSIPVTTLLSAGFYDLSTVPNSPNAAQLYIKTVAGLESPLQISPKDFTLVRSSVGGQRDRLIVNASTLTNTGNGTPIPDADSPPTEGMMDVLAAGETIDIYFY